LRLGLREAQEAQAFGEKTFFFFSHSLFKKPTVFWQKAGVRCPVLSKKTLFFLITFGFWKALQKSSIFVRLLRTSKPFGFWNGARNGASKNRRFFDSRRFAEGEAREAKNFTFSFIYE
jgi:hypothetical protein